MKRIHWILLGVLTFISIIVEFSLEHDPSHDYWWNSIPFFYILYGFIGCVLIIVISKALGKLFIQRKEDYYDAR